MIFEIRHIFIQGVPKSAFSLFLKHHGDWQSLFMSTTGHGMGKESVDDVIKCKYISCTPEPVITKMTLIWTFPKIEIQLEQLVQLFVIGVVIQLINDFKLEFSMKDWYSIWESWTVVWLLGCCSIDKLIIGSHLVWIKLTVQFKRVLLC